MRYIISENQNENLKRYFAIKDLVDSFKHRGLIKIDFDLKFNDSYGFYEVKPTFYFDYMEMDPVERMRSGILKTVLSGELVQRIEDYLGVHIVSHNSKLILHKS